LEGVDIRGVTIGKPLGMTKESRVVRVTIGIQKIAVGGGRDHAKEPELI